MVELPNMVATSQDVRSMLEAIAHLFGIDEPFIAQVAQLARQSQSLEQLEASLVSLYRLGLELDHAYLPDLADELLHWVEQRASEQASSS